MTPGMTHLSPEIDRLVERQLRNWELARAQRPAKPRDPKEVHEFVAISRQVGSGGSQVAHVVAERLGWPLFDRDILYRMAEDDTTRERLYEEMDERDVTWIEQFMELLLEGRFLPHDYFSKLTRCVLSLARGGRAVFLGRAADLILPRNHGLRVRVVAPLTQRVRNYAARCGLEESLAREEVERIDRERAEFVRHHFRRDIDDPTRCDLTLNLENISVASAADLIERILRDRGIAP